MNLYSQEDDYFSRLDHKIVLPFPSKYDIEVVFYPIGRDVTGYFLKVYDPCDGTNFNKSYHKTEGCQKYAVGNSLYSTIIKEIKEVASELIFKNENRPEEELEKLLELVSKPIEKSIRKIDGLYESHVKNYYCDYTGRVLGNARIYISGKKIDNGSLHVISLIGERSEQVAKQSKQIIEDTFNTKVTYREYTNFKQLYVDKSLDVTKIIICLNEKNERLNCIVDKVFNIIIDTDAIKSYYYLTAPLAFRGDQQ